MGAAEVCRKVVDEILEGDPDAKIIIMGDLNDDPVDESVVDVLGATGDRDAVVDLYNP
ncbi:MAG TPA: endonuclease, partial [Bacteroidetes bacterium]|nr:endonuclease [Bacteroidota bacterium]